MLEIRELIEERMIELVREVNLKVSMGSDYIESVVEYCAERGLDVEDIIPMLTPSLIESIRNEAIRNHTIKHEVTPTLP